jgi:methylated-DNA-protein-cysteine methyltransferase-like protein
MEKTFHEKVYEVVARIPKGKVATYQDIAKLAGSPRASRAVGSAMKNNTDTKRVPCHRVVGSDGAMHGYAFGGEKIKIQKLQAEHILFEGKNANLEKCRWGY